MRRLELGRGLAAENAAFTLTASPDRIAIQDFDRSAAAVSIAVTRQGALASLVAEGAWRDVPMSGLAGSSPLQAKLSGALKVGASGETVAALIANLGGAASASHRCAGPGADPQAVARALRVSSWRTIPSRSAAPRDGGRGGTGSRASYGSVGVVRGVCRGRCHPTAPVSIASSSASWQGAVAYDLKSLTLDARGTLVSG